MKTKILTILLEAKDYVSGQTLCESLGVSRTAVWKVMNQLKSEGYEIEAFQNKGYRLIQSPDSLGKSEIMSRLQSQWIGKELIYLEETGSTNTDAKRFAEEGMPHGTLIVTDLQKDGKGRRGRTWSSPGKTNIYFSLILRPDFAPNQASGLTLVMALSVANAIRNISNLSAQIKWPNDIVVNGKKVCGILTEMNAEMDFIHYVVIGVGINVNQTLFSEELPYASSLKKQSGEDISRVQLLLEILKQFEINYKTYFETGSMEGLEQEYNELLVNQNQQVCIMGSKESYEALALGINKQGELLVKKEDGTIEQIYAGEVSVRGLYGYV